MTTTELPKLTGSEKQVAWAEKIRSEALDPSTYHKQFANVVAVMLPVLAPTASKVTSAEEWIDNKSWPLGLLFEKHFDIEKKAAGKVLRVLEDRINYNAYQQGEGTAPSTIFDEDESDSLIRHVGEEKAQAVASAFGFTLTGDRS